MKGTKGRETPRPMEYEDPSIAFFDGFSSPILDRTDCEILSTIEGNPMTILQVSEKMDMSFVESFNRARRLLLMDLVERAPEPEELGLYRYSAKQSR